MTSRPIDGLAGARDLLGSARSVLVLTGAGISAESGVPTFRGAGGLWGEYRAEDLATPEAFDRDPHLVWEWYSWRREQLLGCRPNPAHLALARWQLQEPARVRIATQNVDGLHARALASGASQTPPVRADLVEVHGSIFRSRCTVCEERVEETPGSPGTAAGTLPSCNDCGGLLRPDVVWFGEALDQRTIETAFDWAERADLCLVVGTSALVHPAASLPVATRDSGGFIVEVNPEETPLTRLATLSLRGTAVEIVPRILPPGGDGEQA